MPLRPPCSTSATLYGAETTQDDFDKSQINDNFDTSIQAESTNKFQNLFFKTLFDNLAPECDDTNQQLEYSLYSNDMVIHMFFITFINICLNLYIKQYYIVYVQISNLFQLQLFINIIYILIQINIFAGSLCTRLFSTHQ